jgi:hypothetical protein
MRFTAPQMQTQLDELRSYEPDLALRGTAIPPWHWLIPMADRIEDCNGIGSDDSTVKWTVGLLNAFLKWMLFASVPHDECWCGRWFNDGSRERFEFSNGLFRDLLMCKADRSFGWIPLHFVRERLRAGRREEARKAHAVLMSANCFRIWQANAGFEPGPEGVA